MTTGAYVRIKRDGGFENVEIDQLTDIELAELSKEQPNRGWFWAIFLAKWIRDNVNVATEEDIAGAPW